MHLACRGCKADVVRHLIKFVKERRGAETATSYVNSLTNEGASGLHYAAQIEPSEVGTAGDDRAVIRALLEGGADVSLQTKQAQESAFHHCALAGNNEILSEMISGMSATEVQKALNRQSAVGWTPLLIAAHRGHMELVTTLLANHARVDVFDLEGRSALHLAAEHGYLQVCDALLANKAFINSKSRVGRTALHLAAMNGYSHLVKFLVQDHGAAIDVLTLRKQTPLHLAAGAGQLEVCKLLLELGASIDATDDQGQKPIHAAAMNNYAEVAQLFLQRHPSLVMACTKDGNTCAHIAAMQGSVRVIEELMKFDRQGVISARNKLTEATPLQLAAEGGHAEVVRALVRAGASCADENRAGFTAVHLAAQHGHGQVLEVMRSSQSLRISSKKLGVTALHVAAYFGQAGKHFESLCSFSSSSFFQSLFRHRARIADPRARYGEVRPTDRWLPRRRIGKRVWNDASSLGRLFGERERGAVAVELGRGAGKKEMNRLERKEERETRTKRVTRRRRRRNLKRVFYVHDLCVSVCVRLRWRRLPRKTVLILCTWPVSGVTSPWSVFC